MGGFFGAVLSSGSEGEEDQKELVRDVFYGIDYHSHLGTSTGGMAVWRKGELHYKIQDISRSFFRGELSEFGESIGGNVAIGSISDYEPQPLAFRLKFGPVAIAHVGRMNNLEDLAGIANQNVAFSTMSRDGVNPIEIIAHFINRGKNIEDGIESVQNIVQGSCSLMVATPDAIYVSRDKFGRTPLFIGKKEGAYAAALETCSFENRDFQSCYGLAAGEIGRLTSRGYEELKSGDEENMQICTFLWVYFGNPASYYEGANVERVRNLNGISHAEKNEGKEKGNIDFVAAFPDSGVGHGLGYSTGLKVPFRRPFVKYAQTWQRSFMPPNQEERDHVGKMKLIPIEVLINGMSILFTEDSIVRGTQLLNRTEVLYKYKASKIHMRPSCPPLIFPCDFLNFSRSRGAFDLAGRRAIRDILGKGDLKDGDVRPFTEENSSKYLAMIERIRQDIPHLTTLDYQRLPVLVRATGLSKEKLCTHCWDGSSYCNRCPKK